MSQRSANGTMALQGCAEFSSLEILQLLLGYNTCMGHDGYSMTPLLAASMMGHTSILENLIQEQLAEGETWPGLT